MAGLFEGETENEICKQNSGKQLQITVPLKHMLSRERKKPKILCLSNENFIFIDGAKKCLQIYCL